MRALKAMERSKNFWYLLLLTLTFFVLRLPSLFEPNWYGDEGVYQVIGDAINKGRLLYSQIWDNKPPLLYILYSVLGSDQFSVRLMSLIFGLISVFLFYKIAQKLFLNNRIRLFVTTVFSILLALPLLEGNIANAENFMIMPTLLSGLVILNIKKDNIAKLNNKNLKLALIAGFILSLSFLFKIVALFDFAAFFIFMSIFEDKKVLEHLRNKNYQAFEVKKLFLFCLGFIFLPIITALFFFLKGAFSQFMSATFFSNIGYVGYGNTFIIPQGFLIVKLLLLGLLIVFLYSKRNSISLGAKFILTWFAFTLFDAFFSQRPYTHYLLVLLPSFCLLLGLVLSERKLRGITLPIFVASLFLVISNFNFYIKIFPYYGNFLSLVNNKESIFSYRAFFDRQTPIDYELATFIKTNTSKNDSIFIWGNNAQVYKLSDKLPPGRYTVAYHITNYKSGITETAKALSKVKPKFIIIMPLNNFPFSLDNYRQRIIIGNAQIYERVL